MEAKFDRYGNLRYKRLYEIIYRRAGTSLWKHYAFLKVLSKKDRVFKRIAKLRL